MVFLNDDNRFTFQGRLIYLRLVFLRFYVSDPYITTYHMQHFISFIRIFISRCSYQGSGCSLLKEDVGSGYPGFYFYFQTQFAVDQAEYIFELVDLLYRFSIDSCGQWSVVSLLTIVLGFFSFILTFYCIAPVHFSKWTLCLNLLWWLCYQHILHLVLNTIYVHSRHHRLKNFFEH